MKPQLGDVFEHAPDDLSFGVVRAAYAALSQMGRRHFTINDVILRAGQMASTRPTTGPLAQPGQVRTHQLRPTPASRCASEGLVARLLPAVRRVRCDLFGVEGPRCRSRAAAARWVEQEAQRQPSAGGAPFRLLAYQPPRAHHVARVPVPPGSRLSRLADAAGLLARATGFTEDAVVSWLLMGQAPQLPPARLSMRTTSVAVDGLEDVVTRQEAHLVVYVEHLAYEDFRRLFRALRAAWGVTRLKQPTAEHLTLLRAVDAAGPPPSKCNKKYWTAVAKKIAKQTDWRTVQRRYERLRRQPAA